MCSSAHFPTIVALILALNREIKCYATKTVMRETFYKLNSKATRKGNIRSDELCVFSSSRPEVMADNLIYTDGRRREIKFLFKCELGLRPGMRIPRNWLDVDQVCEFIYENQVVKSSITIMGRECDVIITGRYDKPHWFVAGYGACVREKVSGRIIAFRKDDADLFINQELFTALTRKRGKTKGVLNFLGLCTSESRKKTRHCRQNARGVLRAIIQRFEDVRDTERYGVGNGINTSISRTHHAARYAREFEAIWCGPKPTLIAYIAMVDRLDQEDGGRFPSDYRLCRSTIAECLQQQETDMPTCLVNTIAEFAGFLH